MASPTVKRVIVIALAFALGVTAGAVGYKNLARKPQPPANTAAGPYDRDRELLRDAFEDELVSGEPLVNPPCKTAKDVQDQIAQQFRCFVRDITQPYQTMRAGDRNDDGIATSQSRKDGRLMVSYTLAPAELPSHAWAYGPAEAVQAVSPLSGNTGNYRQSCAVLIIPGTGMNESSRIFRGDKKDYHGDIAAICRQVGDVYVLVKPNEDFLAIHDGKAKLSYLFITSTLLNHERSYSGKYLCDALATIKYLQDRYHKVFVVGLSQGGLATLYVATHANPSGAVVASGYSITSETVDPAGPNQIIAPGIAGDFAKETLCKRIGDSPTQFLFTYGRKERGAYRVEAEEGLTQKAFAGLKNVKFVVHDGGHEFPMSAVLEFLKEQAARPGDAPTSAPVQ